MRAYEYVYDSVGNVILIIELIYYTIAIAYYIYEFIKGRRVAVRKWRYEQHMKRRVHWKRGDTFRQEFSHGFVDRVSGVDAVSRGHVH